MAVKAIYLFLLLLASCLVNQGKKSLSEYTEEDLERLYEQWEENDEETDGEEEEEDEALKWIPSLASLQGMTLDGPESAEELLKRSKKNQPVMLFVTVKGEPSKAFAEQVGTRWQMGLQNGHIQTQLFVVTDDKVLLMVADGSLAWDVKDFLIQQPDCVEVLLEQRTYLCGGDGKPVKEKGKPSNNSATEDGHSQKDNATEDSRKEEL